MLLWWCRASVAAQGHSRGGVDGGAGGLSEEHVLQVQEEVQAPSRCLTASLIDCVFMI